MRGSFLRGLIAAASLVLAAAPGALADTSDSSNWAGYAIHATGTSFQVVTARWRQPRARCVPGKATYSAAWVGLGGFSESSNALEQTGTELDCGPAGKVISSAWFELVPAPARTIRLRVRPGDLMAAKVTVTGSQVSVGLSDLTRHWTFTKTLHARQVDVSSAEWIVEAPSDCVSANSCQTLPLADFGSATFSFAHTVSASGVSGTISNPGWGVTRIRLRPAGTRFVSLHGGVGLGATPLALRARGSSFEVVYSRLQARSGPMHVRRKFVQSARLAGAGR